MSGLASALAWIVALAAVGGFIDFCIGARGQETVRRWLEDYWLRFSYVKPGNAGRREAQFAADMLEDVFRFHDAKRQAIIFLLISISVFSYYIGIYSLFPSIAKSNFQFFFATLEMCFYAYILFFLSTYITYTFAIFASNKLPDGILLNLLYFVVLFVFQSFMLNAGSAILSVITSFINIIGINVLSLIPTSYLKLTPIPFSYESIDDVSKINKAFVANVIGISGVFVDYALDYRSYFISFKLRKWPMNFIEMHHHFFVHYASSLAVNIFRFFIVALFIGSIALRFIHDTVELLWLRLTEQKSPIFTFIFGSAAAVVKFLQEILKFVAN